MKFRVMNAREQHWVEDFGRQNGFTGSIGFYPSIVTIYLSNKTIAWGMPTKEKYPSIVELMKSLQDKEMMMYESGILAGPFKVENITPYLGDKVKIVDIGHIYYAYWEWFNNYPNLAARYAYMNRAEDIIGKVGTIVAMGPHSDCRNETIYAIEFDEGFFKPIYLMNKKAFVVEKEQY